MEMKKILFLLALASVAVAWFAFSPHEAPPEDLPQRGGKWIYTKKVLKVRNLEFRESLETSFIFQFDPLDSLKIRCRGCVEALSEGKLRITYQGGEGQTIGIGRKRLDTWMPLSSVTGKFGLIFSGVKNVALPELEIIRKSDSSRVKPGPDLVPLDVKNLYVNYPADDPDAQKLEFYFDLARKDQITILAKTVSSTLDNLVCDWYKEGEEFDSDIAPFNSPFFIPSDATFYGNYIYEFGVKEKGKENIFNIRVERVPAKIETITDDGVIIDGDTMSDEMLLLKELIEQLQPEKVKQFECKGIATEIFDKVPARLNISPGNNNKTCIPIMLSEECADPTETCPECSFWVFWMGVGDEAVNQYKFRDSTRKLITQQGVIEAYAHAVTFMKSTGSGILPVISEGEDVFYAIVNEANKAKFMKAIQLPPANNQPLGFETKSSGLLISGYKIMPYNPGEQLYLCLCNNNELSPVPVLFNFQQFLSLADTAKKAS